MSKAFSGVRIVDFTQVLAGPIATSQLALLGAHVIKIETPGKGDQLRAVMAEGEMGAHGFGPAFTGVNYAKRSISLNLKHPSAKEIVNRMLKTADVVAENFKPGVIGRLGFGYEAVKAIKPDIIYCSISGFGQSGPAAETGAYDGAIQASSGLMSTTGTADHGPTRIGFPVVDATTGMAAAFAISSGLYRKAMTGEGQYLDVAMTDAITALMNFSVCLNNINGTPPSLIGNRSATGQATTDVYQTKDGYINLSVFADHHVAPMCKALGQPEWADAPFMKTEAGRIANYDKIYSLIGDVIKTETIDTWCARFREVGVAAAPIRTLPEALQAEQLKHRGVMMEMPKPGGLPGKMSVPGSGFIASADSPGTDVPPPTVGQHTDEILAEFGYSAGDIRAFHEDGVV